MTRSNEGRPRSEASIRARNEWKKANQRAMYRLRRLHREDYDRLMAEELEASLADRLEPREREATHAL